VYPICGRYQASTGHAANAAKTTLMTDAVEKVTAEKL
jgi:hypothetical protein